MHPLEVLRRPIVTEKSTLLQEHGKYTFEVSERANKLQVKDAVEKAFNVSVAKVNVLSVPGQTRRFGGRMVKRKPWKKAMVTLNEGERIQFFESV